jgi:hypothetical protein
MPRLTFAQRAGHAIALLVLAGCATQQVNVIHVDRDRAPAAKPPDCHLDVLVHRPPDAPHLVYGTLEYVEHSVVSIDGADPSSGSYTSAMHYLRPKACELGADALIIDEDDNSKHEIRAFLVRYER